MVERAGRSAFCAAPVARGIGSVGVRTQGYAVHVFRLTVADRVRALRGGAFPQALRVGRHYARAGIIVETNAGDVAICHVAARLLASAPFRPYFPQGSGYKTLATAARKDTVVCFRGSVC